jgi:hypothetical protein
MQLVHRRFRKIIFTGFRSSNTIFSKGVGREPLFLAEHTGGCVRMGTDEHSSEKKDKEAEHVIFRGLSIG